MINLGLDPAVTTPRALGAPSSRGWLAALAIATLVAAVQASAVTISGSLVGDDAGTTPKVYHLLLLLAGALVLLRGRIVRPHRELLVYFAVVLSTTLVAYLAFEPRVAVLKLGIALYVALVAATVGRVTGHDTVVHAFRIASAAFLAAVAVKNLLHAPAFVAFLARPSGHPDVPALAGGGLNIEATWLALSAACFVGSALFVPYLLVAVATSALYASRAGVLVGVLVVLAALARWWLARRAPAEARSPRRSRSRFRRVITSGTTVAAIAALGVAATAALEYGDAFYVARRFSSIGGEPGSLGRLTLWSGGLQVFAEYPLGVGIGNAVPALRHVLGIDIPEDNLHNIYLQHLVETGVPGLAALLFLALAVARRVIAARFQDRLLLLIALYLAVGMIQFTGADAMLWLAYGLQMGTSAREAAGD